ncbi:MAG: Zn-ribbon domain-containing OB-fold protein [Chitinispirillaceae bacterium]|nr:Zn-ribbon domain-containing OB-fold protein [Chitinispirillaceae bacterium]
MFKWFGKVNFSPFTKVSAFADHLKDGRVMGSRCTKCGALSFPPRADCVECMHDGFEFFEISGKGTLHTYTKIAVAPTGFDDMVPYTVGLADLKETGRIVAWIGETIPEEEIKIGMEIQVVPRIFEEREKIKVYYTLEKPGTTWSKTDSMN